MNIIVRRLVVLLAGIMFGIIEGGGHVVWGAPNFGPFILEWHGPMLVIFLSVCYLARQFRMFFGMVLLEDITYWIVGHEITPAEWISQFFGGFYVFGIYLPWAYPVLFGLWAVCEYITYLLDFKFELSST